MNRTIKEAMVRRYDDPAQCDGHTAFTAACNFPTPAEAAARADAPTSLSGRGGSKLILFHELPWIKHYLGVG